MLDLLLTPPGNYLIAIIGIGVAISIVHSIISRVIAAASMLIIAWLGNQLYEADSLSDISIPDITGWLPGLTGILPDLGGLWQWVTSLMGI